MTDEQWEEVQEQIRITRAAAQLQTAAVVTALALQGLVDPHKVAEAADVSAAREREAATSRGAAVAAPSTHNAIAESLEGFAKLIRRMATPRAASSGALN